MLGKERRIDLQFLGMGFDIVQGNFRRLFHDISELAGQHEGALAVEEVYFDLQHIAAE